MNKQTIYVGKDLTAYGDYSNGQFINVIGRFLPEGLAYTGSETVDVPLKQLMITLEVPGAWYEIDGEELEPIAYDINNPLVGKVDDDGDDE